LEKHILETAGYEVHVAVDGLEAWERLRELQPDVVISDVEMPRMTGLELAARIKGDEQTRRIPVVLLTSLSKPQQQEAGLKAGADAYLVKSRFEQGELLRVIRSVV
jgi:two-component system chemotaxis sensor kinase CheA